MIPAVIVLLVSGGIQLLGSHLIGLWRADADARGRASLLAQWSMATTLLAIGILLIERLI
mgnify:CR=1 FL=1